MKTGTDQEFKPKYQLGQAVRKTFAGEVEGVKVEVCKILYVWAIQILGHEPAPGQWECVLEYKLCEGNPRFKSAQGRSYAVLENDPTMEPLEPVVEAIAGVSASNP